MTVVTRDPLAVKLNNLAVANSDGLLNDDEYRLLRQNLFERYTGGVEIVSVSSPPAVKHVAAPRQKHVEVVDQRPPRPQPTPARSKMSEVALFLRRATGRKSAPPSSPTPSVVKLSLPRIFSRRHEDASSSDTDSAATRHSSSASFSRKGSSGDLRSSPRGKAQAPALSRPKADNPVSPIRANFVAAATSPSRTTSPFAPKCDLISVGSNIFDDDNLQTSDAIRKAMALVEAECRRLVAAFNDLETSAVIRYRLEHPQRSSSGPETGSKRPVTAPLSSQNRSSQHTTGRSRSNSQRHTPNTDRQSDRSGSSLRTSRSTASLFQNTPPPPTTPAAPAAPVSSWGSRLRRKGSASSLSSQGAASLLSVGRAGGLSRSSSVSRSTSHLPLTCAAPAPVPVHGSSGSGSTMMELLKNPTPGEGGEELAEVRRRRAEMVARCEARLEYLRARLKSAQLHEKLLRK
ncbi:hypothetical protein GGX14DRAFT_385991 [Mycena pura]|uniref:Uncharacterized protein n=1 Tax=Mycena pura TaxID=153505 RepID=A0AAD7E4M7_9AGAR|nr:hypothetical protein GGX14DRAFT_385991 [Mycena pura]